MTFSSYNVRSRMLKFSILLSALTWKSIIIVLHIYWFLIYIWCVQIFAVFKNSFLSWFYYLIFKNGGSRNFCTHLIVISLTRFAVIRFAQFKEWIQRCWLATPVKAKYLFKEGSPSHHYLRVDNRFCRMEWKKNVHLK